MAIYECHKCEREEFVPRRYRYHFGPTCRCPVCGTYRVVRLKERDKIDRMHSGFLNLVEKAVGRNRLYHCRWCRLQFFDRRPLAAESEVKPVREVVPDPLTGPHVPSVEHADPAK